MHHIISIPFHAAYLPCLSTQLRRRRLLIHVVGWGWSSHTRRRHGILWWRRMPDPQGRRRTSRKGWGWSPHDIRRWSSHDTRWWRRRASIKIVGWASAHVGWRALVMMHRWWTLLLIIVRLIGRSRTSHHIATHRRRSSIHATTSTTPGRGWNESGPHPGPLARFGFFKKGNARGFVDLFDPSIRERRDGRIVFSAGSNKALLGGCQSHGSFSPIVNILSSSSSLFCCCGGVVVAEAINRIEKEIEKVAVRNEL